MLKRAKQKFWAENYYNGNGNSLEDFKSRLEQEEEKNGKLENISIENTQF